MTYSQKLKLFPLVMIAFMLLLIAVFLFLLPEKKVEGRTPNQFLDTSFAYWEADLGIWAELSKYTPRPEETDLTPEITASNQKVREGIVANNCLPFGTLVEIGGETYEVQDRLNTRYGCENFDILTFSLEEARSFGRQTGVVRIISD